MDTEVTCLWTRLHSGSIRGGERRRTLRNGSLDVQFLSAWVHSSPLKQEIDHSLSSTHDPCHRRPITRSSGNPSRTQASLASARGTRRYRDARSFPHSPHPSGSLYAPPGDIRRSSSPRNAETGPRRLGPGVEARHNGVARKD